MALKAQGGVIADALPGEAERRSSPRVLLDLEVDYASEDNYLFAYITDLSVTGIFIRTTSPEAPGTQLNLRFKPDDSGPIELEGEVIWVNPFRPGTPDNLHPGMGIRFAGLDDDIRARLLGLMRRFAYL
ncbi:MAG TPA: TIGR02266 family protein [Kofleriaceae bacterium]|nr:TIGR02266 family protein [Kofleriaceae bacterium]